MSLEDTVAHLLQFTATFDLRMAGVLFALCAVGEFGLSIPYVLESVWLMTGYHLGAGVLSPLHFVGLWLAAQFGRQVGAVALYQVGRYGSAPLLRWYRQGRMPGFISRVVNSKAARRVNIFSPFSVALGRLFWMRIPLSLTLGARKDLRTLLVGVLISSLIWDAIYILVGLTVGATAVVEPVYMFVYSLAGLTLFYLVTFGVRRLVKRSRPSDTRAA